MSDTEEEVTVELRSTTPYRQDVYEELKGLIDEFLTATSEGEKSQKLTEIVILLSSSFLSPLIAEEAGVITDPSDPRISAAVRNYQNELFAVGNLILTPEQIEEMRQIITATLSGAEQVIYSDKIPLKDADPIILYKGEFSHQVEDMSINGAGITFTFKRTYGNQSIAKGRLGFKWDYNYNLWLRISPSGEAIFRTNGDLVEHAFTRHTKFGQAGFNYYVPENGEHGVIVENGSDSFRYITPDGNQYIYDRYSSQPFLFRIRSIQDKHGNFLDFQFDDSLLKYVTVNDPLRVVRFEYDDQDRIISIKDYVTIDEVQGREWRYSYDDFGDLVAITTPPTDRYRSGLTTCYEYSSSQYSNPVIQHNLTRIIDPAGQLYLENEYGSSEGLLNFNRVIRQRQGKGEWLFEYDDIIEEFDYDYEDIERPAHQTNIVQRNGHFVHHIYNKFGNLLLQEEEILLEGVVQVVKWRYRYNADGNLIGVLSPDGVMTQYYYGREHYLRENRISDDDVRDHTELTMQKRMAFGNLLAVVRRGRRYRFDMASLDLSRGIWGNFYPDVITAQNRDGGRLLDIITKFSYEDQFQQLLTQSDPRYTESAASNSVLDSPRYFQTLTKYKYSGTPRNPNLNLYLAEVIYPDMTQADGSILYNISKKYTRYDSKGKLEESIDEAGTVTRYDYYGPADGRKNGFLKSITIDPAGLNIKTQYEVNDGGLVTSDTNPLGNKTVYDVNSLDQITRVVSCAPFYYQTFFFYNPNNQIEKTVREIKDENGVPLWGGVEVNTYTYDEQNILLCSSIGGQDPSTYKTIRNRYNESDKLVATVLPRGNIIQRSYDARLFEIGMTRGAGSDERSTSRTQYSKDGLPVKRIDGRGKVTILKYDVFNRLEQTIDPIGNVMIKQYDKIGNGILEGFFEDLGNGKYRLLSRTAFQYDQHNNQIILVENLFQDKVEVEQSKLIATLASFSFPSRSIRTQYFYDRVGRIVKLVDAKEQATTFTYDTLGRRISTVNALGNYSENVYDSNGNITRQNRHEKIINPSGALLWTDVFSTFFHYDPLDRLILTVDSLGNKNVFSYDSRNSLIKMIDALGNVKRFEFDVYGLKAKEILQITETGIGVGSPIGIAVTSFEYDSNDNQIAYVDSKGSRIVQDFDSLDRLTIVRHPDGSIAETRYDENDNIILTTDNNGLRIIYKVDDLNRVIRIDLDRSNIAAGTVIDGTSFEEFDYDGLGRVTSDRNDYVSTSKKFDSLGRSYYESIVSRTPSIPTIPSYTILREFDELGFLTKITYPSGRMVRYELDKLNRVSRIENSNNGTNYPGSAAFPSQYDILRIEYRGLRKGKAIFANRASVELAYDKGSRLIQSIHRRTNEPPYLIMQELHDGANNVRIRTNIFPNASQGEAYKYNSFYWLSKRELRANQQFNSVDFEPSRNLEREEDLDGQSRINNMIGALEQPSSNLTYEYDLVGNRRVGRQIGEAASYRANDLNQYLRVDEVALNYDLNGNLVKNGKWQFFYDYRNRLVRVRDTERAVDIIKFLYDAQGHRFATIDGMTTISIHDGTNVIEEYRGNQVLAQFVYEHGIDSICQIVTQGNEHWYHTDSLGSCRLLTDSSGRISGRYRYLPFGTAAEAAGPYNPIRFMSRYFDELVGLYDFRTRTYIPKLGRFAQRDLIPASNLYMFVDNNPLASIDPTGREKESSQPAVTPLLDLQSAVRESLHLLQDLHELNKQKEWRKKQQHDMQLMAARAEGALDMVLKIQRKIALTAATLAFLPAADLVIVGEQAIAAPTLLQSAVATLFTIRELTKKEDEPLPLVAGTVDSKDQPKYAGRTIKEWRKLAKANPTLTGTEYHKMVADAMRKDIGRTLEGGWRLVAVEYSIGTRRLDALYVNDTTRKFFVEDVFTGERPSASHLRKTWSSVAELRGLLEKGYQPLAADVNRFLKRAPKRALP